jgi:hypothetical protein
MVSVRGMLDAESAASLRTAIEALSTPAGHIDPRTCAQRRADALVEMARRALDGGGLPEMGGERPHVTVMVELAALRQDGRAALRAPTPAELVGGGPLGAHAARRISCDAVVSRVVTDARSRPGDGQPVPAHYLEALPPQLRGPTQVLDVGRSSRTATAAIRRALAVRDKGCVMPGCDRPPSRCEAHHVVHWADGGATALDNCVLLCGFHHHFVHDHGWQISISIDGSVLVTPPMA